MSFTTSTCEWINKHTSILYAVDDSDALDVANLMVVEAKNIFSLHYVYNILMHILVQTMKECPLRLGTLLGAYRTHSMTLIQAKSEKLWSDLYSIDMDYSHNFNFIAAIASQEMAETIFSYADLLGLESLDHTTYYILDEGDQYCYDLRLCYIAKHHSYEILAWLLHASPIQFLKETTTDYQRTVFHFDTIWRKAPEEALACLEKVPALTTSRCKHETIPLSYAIRFAPIDVIERLWTITAPLLGDDYSHEQFIDLGINIAHAVCSERRLDNSIERIELVIKYFGVSVLEHGGVLKTTALLEAIRVYESSIELLGFLAENTNNVWTKTGASYVYSILLHPWKKNSYDPFLRPCDMYRRAMCFLKHAKPYVLKEGECPIPFRQMTVGENTNITFTDMLYFFKLHRNNLEDKNCCPITLVLLYMEKTNTTPESTRRWLGTDVSLCDDTFSKDLLFIEVLYYALHIGLPMVYALLPYIRFIHEKNARRRLLAHGFSEAQCTVIFSPTVKGAGT